MTDGKGRYKLHEREQWQDFQKQRNFRNIGKW